MTKRHFKPECRQEVAELVLDKGYSVKEAADAMSVGKSTIDKWVRQLRKEREGLCNPPLLMSLDSTGHCNTSILAK